MNDDPLVLVSAFVAAAAGGAALAAVVPDWVRGLRFRLGEGLAADLGRSFVFVHRGRLLAINGTALLISAAGVWLLSGSVLAAMLVALAVALLPRLLIAWVERRRALRFRAQVPELLNLLSGGLRAGNALSVVIAQIADEMAPPAGQELALMQREQRMGASFERTLDRLSRRVRLEEAVLLCAALKLGNRTGGGIADTLDSLADSTRRKLALEGKVRALTAQGRLQSWVMGGLPAVIVGLLALIEPTMLDSLTGTWAGRVVCVGVLCAQIVGLLMIRSIVRIDV
ncbi:MAG: type II secretion system F family protein [Burkholderiaceae bacterium]|nr:type II secretion system F family protein [Burkholderiaceae bacterium]